MVSFLEILLEALLQIFGDAIIDAVSRSRNPVLRALTNAVISALLAGLFAAGSLAVYPHHIIGNAPLRCLPCLSCLSSMAG